MFASDAQIGANVVVGSATIVQAKSSILVEGDGASTTIGEGSIIEDLVEIRNSAIGSNCLIEVKAHIDEVRSSFPLASPVTVLLAEHDRGQLQSGCAVSADQLQNQQQLHHSSRHRAGGSCHWWKLLCLHGRDWLADKG